MEPEDRALSLLLDLKRKAYKSSDQSLQKLAPEIKSTYKHLREVAKQK
jgi:flagellar biosynthesis chaperone FliJ